MSTGTLRRYRNRVASERDAERAAAAEDVEAVVSPPLAEDAGDADRANVEQREADLAEQAANAEAAAADGENVESVNATVEAATPSEPSAEQPAGPELPALNASTDTWREYAESAGGFPGDLATASRTELVEHYTK